MQASIDAIRRHATAAGRDPDAIELQGTLTPPPRDQAGKDFYRDHGRVVARAEQVRDLGFGWLAINATAVFQAGARSVADIAHQLDTLHTKLRAALG